MTDMGHLEETASRFKGLKFLRKSKTSPSSSPTPFNSSASPLGLIVASSPIPPPKEESSCASPGGSATSSDLALSAGSDSTRTSSLSASSHSRSPPRVEPSQDDDHLVGSNLKKTRMPIRQRLGRHFGNNLSPEKPYLSYHDVCLTNEDIRMLREDWLTDNNIAFWEEYLERETLPRYPQARIILLRPTMTIMMMKERNLKNIIGALPDFSKATHVFLPINDVENVAVAEGGSHWSLLLVSVIDGVAFHYDSLLQHNNGCAQHATKQMSVILGRGLFYNHIENCPQQDNSIDCGVFVCLIMRHLLVNRLLRANAKEKVSMSMAGKMVDSTGGRKEMLKIIESLRKEGERRRSRSASPLTNNKTPPRIE